MREMMNSRMRRRLLAWVLMAGLSAAQGFRDRLGVEVDQFDDSSRSRPFVNHAKLFRPCTVADGSLASVDVAGWPTTDAQCVMFDVRPIPAWAPPIDDPEQFQPDWSGTWNLSLKGRADVAVVGGGATVNNSSYDATTDTLTAEVRVARGTGLLVLNFRNTRGGFRELRMIRPGYAADSAQIYSDEFLRSFMPFGNIRYMDLTDTNNSTPSANPGDLLEWKDRRLVSDATQQRTGRKTGAAWEYAILLANQTGTDMWINIPVAASDDYIRQLARLITARLNKNLRVYIEHGNEVWNALFANSYNFNRNAALAEVAAGGSKLNSDGITDPDALAVRRHLRRAIEAVKIFSAEMGSDQINNRIRGVFAWWTIFPERYQGALSWYQSVYGPPSAMLYGVAQTHYYNPNQAGANGAPEELVSAMVRSSDGGLGNNDAIRDIAARFGLRHMVYEGGPDVGGGSTANVGNRIRANRIAPMKDLVVHDAKDNFFDRGGSEYAYFSHCGSCSRYGCWGATEDIVDSNAPKLAGLKQLAGTSAGQAVVTAVTNAASGTADISPGSFVTLRGQNLANGSWLWNEGVLDGSPALPSMLGGVQVRIAGKNAWVQYASASQVNVVIPPDVPAGPTTLEVFTRSGVYTGAVDVKSLSPGVFAFVLGGRSYASAVFAGTAVYVAREGALPGVQSRTARSGDAVELYATGLGATAQPYRANQVLDKAYPVADLSKVRVTIGGRSATVLFAGLTYSGVFQINVQIPDGLDSGDQPVVLTTDGTTAQTVLLPVGL